LSIVSAIQTARSKRRKKKTAGYRQAFRNHLGGVSKECDSRSGQGRKPAGEKGVGSGRRGQSEAGERLTVLGNRSRN